MIRNLLAAVFPVALLAWCWLEFFVPSADDGLKDILFWIGMLAVLFTAYDRRRSDA
ncbi:hypothetical protein [Brevundimonas subvibrioides]|uniref:Uncharacterized protein n=1 Tax=Brevundimonas subvibrioides (strain ATCC 15264 / DSM 4735 / LMG 14903 / NBRC 16000 / CB 81) TaxID=633149 RepID=D9QM64_BRESC|nr:hypothetical protein [Brevundimonas subvibrioides]ADL01990.1 hypothetical protein Bresu_2683 [Brevundimonas subvibrioides ATCC 15264]